MGQVSVVARGLRSNPALVRTGCQHRAFILHRVARRTALR